MNSKIQRFMWGKNEPAFARKVSLCAVVGMAFVDLALPFAHVAFNPVLLHVGMASLLMMTWFLERKSAQRQLQTQKIKAQRDESR